MIRDEQSEPSLIFGLGGIFAEDCSLRVAPLDKHDAVEMIMQIKGRGRLADIVIAVGAAALVTPI